VAATLVEIALGEPVNGVVELAGPQEFRLDELVLRKLSANNDQRRVTVDIQAPYFGGERADRPDPLLELAQPVDRSAVDNCGLGRSERLQRPRRRRHGPRPTRSLRRGSIDSRRRFRVHVR
jgi:hypothetical protein